MHAFWSRPSERKLRPLAKARSREGVNALHVSWGHSEVEEVGGWVGEDDPRLVVGVDDQLDAEAATVFRLQFVLGVPSELSSSAEPRDIVRWSVDGGDVVEGHGSLG